MSLPEAAHKILQRVVPDMQNYGTGGGRHDSLMMKSSEDPDAPCFGRFISLLFAKEIFLRIYMKHALFAHVVSEVESEVGFLQYYKLCSFKELSIHVVKKHLNFFRLHGN